MVIALLKQAVGQDVQHVLAVQLALDVAPTGDVFDDLPTFLLQPFTQRRRQPAVRATPCRSSCA